jgi:hypothetical protein
MLTFPSDVANLTVRPFVVFECEGSQSRAKSKLIALPIPSSLTFGDESTYNNAELGILGASVGSLAGQVAGGAGLKDVMSSADAAVAKAVGNASIGSIIQGITAASGAGEGLQSAVSIGTGTTLNKNIQTEFTATNTRTFSFAFQLIARNSKERNTIKSIVNEFRLGLYPEGDFFQLRYPPKWKIRFLRSSGISATDLEDIPKIGSCYLTGVQTAYNSTSNMWHTDGSPLETTVTVTFMETQAHTLDSLPK